MNLSGKPPFVPESECKSTAFIFNSQEKHGKNFTFFSQATVLALSDCRNNGTFEREVNLRVLTWQTDAILAWRDFSAFSSENHHFSEKNTEKVWRHGGGKVKNMGFCHLAKVDWVEIHGFFCVKNGGRVRKNIEKT